MVEKVPVARGGILQIRQDEGTCGRREWSITTDSSRGIRLCQDGRELNNGSKEGRLPNNSEKGKISKKGFAGEGDTASGA